MRKSRTVRVSEDVFARLQNRARPLDDTVSSVMERVLDKLERLELDDRQRRWNPNMPDWDDEQAWSRIEEEESRAQQEVRQGGEPLDEYAVDRMVTAAEESFGARQGGEPLDEYAVDRMVTADEEEYFGSTPRIILSPVNAGANEHYRNTVENPVSLEKIKEFITYEDWNELSTLYPDGEALIWGYAAGPRNRKNFARVQVDDIVLMYQNAGYFSSFRVAKKLESELAAQLVPELSRMLWGLDRDGYTRDLIYFLTDGRQHKKIISVGDVAKIAGQGPRTTVRGLWVLDRTPSTRVIEKFGLAR